MSTAKRDNQNGLAVHSEERYEAELDSNKTRSTAGRENFN